MKKFIYITAEYNPPHSGHKYMIDEVRRLHGDCTVIAVMSGNFIERGSAAVANKYVRAKAALAIGADLVLSLPFPWCAASAEYFAHASVSVASALASAMPEDEHLLAFGSESGSIDEIKLTGARLASPEFRQKLAALPAKERTARGLEALYSESYPDGTAALLSSPNNTLAVEYVRAIYESGSPLIPFTVKREGAGHDSDFHDLHPSASYVRSRIYEGDDITGLVPDGVRDVLNAEFAVHGAAHDENYGDAVLAALRFLSPESVDRIAECSGGVGRRLIASAKSSASLSAALSDAATKQYTNARLRRASIFAALGVLQSDLCELPEYTSVLAANEKGTSALRAFGKQSKIAILTKSADAETKLSDSARRQFALEARADLLYTLAFDPHLPADAFARLSPTVTKPINAIRKDTN